MKYRNLELINGDCLEYIKGVPDGSFDLAVVDPPYGNNVCGGKTYRTGGQWASKYRRDINKWDVAPDKEYFTELFRVSKYQIIWGGNYFSDYLPSAKGFIIWDKKNIPDNVKFGMCEYAWTNLNITPKIIRQTPQGSKSNPRIHPTQKPVELYSWIYDRHANAGYKILDTHMGSGSSAIAALGRDINYTGLEINSEYFNKLTQRITNYGNSILDLQ